MCFLTGKTYSMTVERTLLTLFLAFIIPHLKQQLQARKRNSNKTFLEESLLLNLESAVSLQRRQGKRAGSLGRKNMGLSLDSPELCDMLIWGYSFDLIASHGCGK